jgi:LDH2 family malate/lactate/ureidoglycolate dehydrogenase
VRLWLYEKRMRAGLIRPAPAMRLERTGPGTAILHGGNGAGQVVGQRAMQAAIALAKEAGVACVAAHESHHFGTAAWFAMQALPHDMIGVAVTHADTGVAPFGAARGFLGTNPFCVAIPAGSEEPIVLDMATSVVAMGKVLAAKAAGKSIPLGWAMDVEGWPTTDPAKAWEGALLPLGGPKGFGIGLVLEVLSALLVGSPFGPHIPRPFELKEYQNLGHFFAALDITRFLPAGRPWLRGDPAARRAGGALPQAAAERRHPPDRRGSAGPQELRLPRRRGVTCRWDERAG